MTRPPQDPGPGETTISDTRTTTAGDADALERIRPPGALVVTIVYHPDIRRIGDRFVLPWRTGRSVSISRKDPVFCDPGFARTSPIRDRGLSRRPVRLVCTDDGLRVEPEKAMPYRLGGRPLDQAVSIPHAVLSRGVWLECARRVVLWLDGWESEPKLRPPADLIGVSAATDRLRGHIESLAPHDLPVAINGESGTGKELVARALHAGSRRADGAWIPVNVGALNPSTAAAELFGHARGAFTGADQARPGFFRRADRGTLFLDEIGSLPQGLQPMLLRALESGEIQPVGEAPRRVDVRLVTATDADLDQLAAAGAFFGPLMYRIRTTRILLPPLRARTADIPLLFARFVIDQLDGLGRTMVLDAADTPWLSWRIVERLLAHRWPGNVRELRNLAVQTALESGFDATARLPAHFEAHPWPASSGPPPGVLAATPALNPAERQWAVPPDALRAALRRHGWRVRPVADELGIARNTIYAMMGRLGIRRPGDLTASDIDAAQQAVGSRDVPRLAEHLEVSVRGLKLRLRALGMTLD